MAEGVATLYGSIESLKAMEDGANAGVIKKAEVLRLWGVMEWILKLGGGPMLEELEEMQLAGMVLEGLQKAKEEMAQVDVVSPVAYQAIVEAPPEATHYMELPGPLVRENVYRFLGSEDLRNVALAIPYEEEYVSQQDWTFAQLAAVYAVLMERRFLGIPESENLCLVNSHCAAFVIKYFEDVQCKSMESFAELAEHIPPPPPVFRYDREPRLPPILGHIKVFFRGLGIETDVDLRTNGHRILHCSMIVCLSYLDRQDVLPFLISCLQLVPNLRTLNIYEVPSLSENADIISPELLPDLPLLKNLYMLCFSPPGQSVLQSPMTVKYGANSDQVWIKYFSENTNVTNLQIPAEGASLSRIHLENLSLLGTPNWLTFLSACPLKDVYLSIHFQEPELLRLLNLLGRWANTLEVLKIRLLPLGYRNVIGNENPLFDPIWLSNPQFPKLKSFWFDGYPVFLSWNFLLLFPALEQLSYCWSAECPIADTGTENQTMVKVYYDRKQMLTNSIWKVLPSLGKISYKAEGQAEYISVTRRKWITENRKMNMEYGQIDQNSLLSSTVTCMRKQ